MKNFFFILVATVWISSSPSSSTLLLNNPLHSNFGEQIIYPLRSSFWNMYTNGRAAIIKKLMSPKLNVTVSPPENTKPNSNPKEITEPSFVSREGHPTNNFLNNSTPKKINNNNKSNTPVIFKEPPATQSTNVINVTVTSKINVTVPFKDFKDIYWPPKELNWPVQNSSLFPQPDPYWPPKNSSWPPKMPSWPPKELLWPYKSSTMTPTIKPVTFQTFPTKQYASKFQQHNFTWPPKNNWQPITNPWKPTTTWKPMTTHQTTITPRNPQQESTTWKTVFETTTTVKPIEFIQQPAFTQRKLHNVSDWSLKEINQYLNDLLDPQTDVILPPKNSFWQPKYSSKPYKENNELQQDSKEDSKRLPRFIPSLSRRHSPCPNCNSNMWNTNVRRPSQPSSSYRHPPLFQTPSFKFQAQQN